MTADVDHIIKVPRFTEANGFYTTPVRSRTMSRIRGKNTKPEVTLRKALYTRGFRFRINAKNLPGRPDISNKSRKIAIFVDGDFWHGKDWKIRKDKLKSNREFWITKIERNIQRDKEVNDKLAQMGFKVFRFWESEIKKDLDGCVEKIMEYEQFSLR